MVRTAFARQAFRSHLHPHARIHPTPTLLHDARRTSDPTNAKRFRKNLKKLYILHPTFFTRTLVQLLSTGGYFVSPKFARKIVQLPTLAELARHVDVRQIDLPPEVGALDARLVEEQARSERKLKEQQQQQQRRASGAGSAEKAPGAVAEEMDAAAKVFGVPLESLMGERGEKGGVPRVLRDCADFLRSVDPLSASSPTDGDSDDADEHHQEEGGRAPLRLCTEGIFRRSPSSALLKAAQEAYDRGSASLATLENNYHDPHIAAVLIKLFFRMLPKPVFSATLYPVIRACPRLTAGAKEGEGDNSEEVIAYIREHILAAIEPPCYLTVLSFALGLLHDVSRYSAQNRMDASNLATVFTPNLLRSGNAIRDVGMSLVIGAPSMAGGPAAASSTAAGMMKLPGAAAAAGTSSGVAGEMTLGTVIKICIERYYEIFDELDFEPRIMTFDQSELLDTADASMVTAPLPSHSAFSTAPGTPSKASITGTGTIRRHRKVDSGSSLGRFVAANSAGGAAAAGQQGAHASSPSLRSARSGEFSGLFHNGTLGLASMSRNASGSLRLTKGRLGSSAYKGIPPALYTGGTTTASAPPTASGLAISGAGGGSMFPSATKFGLSSPMPIPPSSAASLTGTSSAVTVTGANAQGRFTSGAGDDAPAAAASPSFAATSLASTSPSTSFSSMLPASLSASSISSSASGALMSAAGDTSVRMRSSPPIGGRYHHHPRREVDEAAAGASEVDVEGDMPAKHWEEGGEEAPTPIIPQQQQQASPHRGQLPFHVKGRRELSLVEDVEEP